jgi:flagellar biosynthesis protein FlhF
MRIKTYTSDSVPKALAQIRRELGSGAVILDTKRKKKSRFLGLFPSLAYEITAASEASSDTSNVAVEIPEAGKKKEERPVDAYEVASSPPQEKTGSAALLSMDRSLPAEDQEGRKWPHQLEKLTAEIEELKRLIRIAGQGHSDGPSLHHRELLYQQLHRLVFQDFREGIEWPEATKIAEEFQRLIAQGVEEELAIRLLRSAITDLKDHNREHSGLKLQLNRTVSDLVPISRIGESREGVKAAIFVGPTGVGKTTTIAKVAAQFALREERKIRLLTLDTYRIAAAEQLKTFGELIGVPVDVLFSTSDLKKAIAHCAEDEFLLIDTNGHSPRASGDFAETTQYLREESRIETNLVLSATTRGEELKNAIEGFSAYAPDQLIFTKLDESLSFGVVLSQLVRARWPLSLLTNGQKVPDDMIVPDSRTVSDLIVPVN